MSPDRRAQRVVFASQPTTRRPFPPSTAHAVDWQRLSSTLAEVDWNAIGKSALGSVLVGGLVGGALHLLTKAISTELSRSATAPPTARIKEPDDAPAESEESETSDDANEDGDEEIEAAALLGIAVNATADEVRAALRAKLASSRLHPDHGGDGDAATRLIAAKNLLIERARDVRP